MLDETIASYKQKYFKSDRTISFEYRIKEEEGSKTQQLNRQNNNKKIIFNILLVIKLWTA